MNRRILIKLMGGSAVVIATVGAQPRETPAAGLARLFGLNVGEEVWVADLTPAEQLELYQALTSVSDDSLPPRALELAARIVSRRSRLFAFVGYPARADERTICDGLIRE